MANQIKSKLEIWTTRINDNLYPYITITFYPPPFSQLTANFSKHPYFGYGSW